MKIIIITFICILFFLQGCYAARVDGPYEGRVVDAETGQPIEGVVVLGVWNTVTVTPGGGVSSYYDAMETVTDKNGEFKISGLGLKIMSNIAPMDVVIFKAGYEHLGLMPWISLKEDILLSKKIKWEGEKAIIPLIKWSLKERQNRLGSYYVVGVPEEKQKLLLKELEKENKEIGK